MYAADSLKWHTAVFSNACKKAFTLPSPRDETEAYIDALIDIVKKHQIDLVIPTSEETLSICQHLERFPCRVFCSPFEKVIHLHNKWYFAEKLRGYGMQSPLTVLVNSQKDLENLPFTGAYCLKPVYSRAAAHLVKVEAGAPPPQMTFNDKNPWIAQEWIDGRLHCSFSICNEGVVKGHSSYPMRYAGLGQWCISFESIDHPKILSWIKEFVAKENYTGQIAFDFIQKENGDLYPLECNPRCTSGIHLFPSQSKISEAYFSENQEMIHAPVGIRKQIRIAMMLWGWRSSYPDFTWPSYLRELFSVSDILFNKRDLLPCIIEPFLIAHYAWRAYRMGMSIPASFTYSSDWNG